VVEAPVKAKKTKKADAPAAAEADAADTAEETK
jgi:hypothetical protein